MFNWLEFSFKVVYKVKICLQFHFKFYLLDLFQTQLWQSKHIVKYVWWFYQILEESWIGVLNCPICIWSMCTDASLKRIHKTVLHCLVYQTHLLLTRFIYFRFNFFFFFWIDGGKIIQVLMLIIILPVFTS